MRSVFMLLVVCAASYGQYLVSARSLAHRIPGRAAKEYERSLETIRAGGYREAMDRLQGVLNLDSEFAQAHNAMGFCQLHSNRFGDALASFEKAAELDPGSAMIQVNASVTLLALGRHADAEKAARRAVTLDPLSPEARYAVGECLLWQGKFTDEALHYFQRAEERYPRARLMAGYVHFQSGRLREAVDSIRQYLATADAKNRVALEVWVKHAERQLTASAKP